MPQAIPGASFELPIEHRPVVLIGPLGTGKSACLRERYVALLRAGVPAESVLVWVPNRNQLHVWRECVRHVEFPHGELRVSTFRSWVIRELQLNWPLVESSRYLPGLPQGPDPFFIGLSAAQQVLREIVAPLRLQYPALERSHTPPFLQLIQVLDTYARLVENGLSPTREEVVTRLDQGHMLNRDSPELHDFISHAISRYRDFCLGRRLLDYNAQLELFYRVLWQDSAYRRQLKNETAYLIVDNIEETIPITQELVAELQQSCRGVVLARDTNGGLREYLGGDPLGADELISSILRCDQRRYTFSQLIVPEMAAFAAAISLAVTASPLADPPQPVPGVAVTVHDPQTLRLQMFKALERRIFELLDAGASAGQIVIIAPTVDQLLIHHVQRALASRNQLLRVLTGSNRVIDYRSVRTLLTFARLAQPIRDEPPLQQDVTEALECLFELQPLQSSRLARLVFDGSALIDPASLVWKGELQGLKDAYSSLYAWVKQRHSPEVGLDRLLEEAFANLYAPRRLKARPPEKPASAGTSLPASRPTSDDELDVLQIAHLIDNARGYRKLAATMEIPATEVAKRFLSSIYAGEVADTPLIPYNSLAEAVSLFTAAKYAELGQPVRHQLWVDAGSPHWSRSSTREMMNPMVLSRRWRDGIYTDVHDRRHQAEKLALTLQTIVLKATGTVDVFSSDYGSDGSELTGDLVYWLTELTSGLQGDRA